jgi:[acyl-carrier-protein] S-malonyltransferase
MSTQVAVVFPGQGTQMPGMGAPWRDRPEWQAVVGRAEAALGEPLGRLLLDADADELLRTRNAQLAVLLTSLLAWEAVCDRVVPVAFAGHSLGQVTALIASGVMPFEDGVRFAAVRAVRTQAAADATPGVMAALLGATLEQAEAAETAGADCWIANDNAPGQVVLAGTPEGLEAGVAAAKAAGARTAKPLAVGGAFHTPLMQPAADALVADLAAVSLAAPSAPVVSNHDGEPYSDAEGWRARSAAHVAVPVRWRSAQGALVELGADRLVEVGHGSMLAALAKRAIPGTPVQGIGDPVAADAGVDLS